LPQTNYVFAYEEACRNLVAQKSPQAIAARTGCRYVAPAGPAPGAGEDVSPPGEAASFFEVPFLGRLYRVAYPQGQVTPGDPLSRVAPAAAGVAGPEPDLLLPAPPAPSGDHLLTVSILILHYLTKAQGLPITGEWIAFRELPGGEIYNAPFTNRTIRPMVGRFGREPAKLIEAGERLGGRKETFGHASIRLEVFPMVPLCFVVWEGDEEIPASGQILFDRSASAYLDTEDLVVVAAEAFLTLRMAVSPGVPRPGTLEPA
jgi:hypothetical protein